MKELLAIASQFDELAARIAALMELHATDVEAEARFEAAHQASARAARLIRRQVKAMRASG